MIGKTQMKITRFAALMALPLTLAACEDFEALMTNKDPASVPPPQAVPLDQLKPPSVSPLHQPIEVAGAETRAVATAEASTAYTMAFTAQGNEPFWSVDVAGDTATYKTPDNQKGRSVKVQRLVFAKGVEYVGTLGGQSFALTIRGTPCSDSMADKSWPMTASLRTGGRSMTGCAAPAETAQTGGPAPAARATPQALPKVMASQ